MVVYGNGIRFLAFIDYKINHRSKGKLNFNERGDAVAVPMENYDYVYSFFRWSGWRRKFYSWGVLFEQKR